MNRFIIAGLVLALVVSWLTACGPFGARHDETPPPWKDGGQGVVITAAPDAGGPLSFRNCPTLDEAAAAVPGLVSGPDANAVPFKTMVLQCGYAFDERGVKGRASGIGILVFDASAEGPALWDSVRSDSSFPDPADVADLGDRAFATGSKGHHDLWVVSGDYGFHMLHDRIGEIPLDQMVALGHAMVEGLERPPR